MGSQNRETVPGGNIGAPAAIRRPPRATGWAVALLIGMLVAAPASAEVMDCYELWGIDGIGRDQREAWGAGTTVDGTVTTATPCELYEPASTNLSSEFGVEIKIYLPAGFEASPHPDAPRNVPELIAQATGDSLRRLRPRFEPFKITIALLQNVPRSFDDDGDPTAEFDWGPMAEATGSRNSGCRISVYVTAIVNRLADGGTGLVSPEDVKSTLAHEIFHCYQAKYFNAQFNGAAGLDEGGWWTEGTADFFADMVYPCAGETVRHATAYVAEDRLNLQRLPYSTVAFYMHLANRHGFDLSALADFMGSMPTTSGFQPQHDALAAQPDIAAKFHDYGEAYTDGDIPCAGAAVGFGSAPVKVTVTNGTEISLSQAPFRFKRAIAVLEQGTQYRARLESSPGGAGGDPTTSYRLEGEQGPDSWTILPEDLILSAGCDEEKTYVILTTVYGTDTSVLDVKLGFEEVESPFAATPEFGCCVDTGEHDQCLVGTWVRDNAFARQQMQAFMRSMGADVNVSMPRGELRVTFRENGTATGLGGQSVSVDGVAAGEPVSIDNVIDAAGAGRWSTTGNSVLYSCPTREQTQDINVTTFPDGLQEIGSPLEAYVAAVGLPERISFDYVCRGGILEMQLPGIDMKQRYRRVGSQ